MGVVDRELQDKVLLVLQLTLRPLNKRVIAHGNGSKHY